MRCAIRVDASSEIGTGHVMRCLTLANALQQAGASVMFFSRAMPEVLRKIIAAQGHAFGALDSGVEETPPSDLAHGSWLGASQEADARAVVDRLPAEERLAWLIVDHYALDHRWESALRSRADRILAIDDLADRVHDCDLLMDQNWYANAATRYAAKVPPQCEMLLGPRYALLRDEFREARDHVRPRDGTVARVLVFFGGIDIYDHTSHAIDGIAKVGRAGLHVDVVIGSGHPNRAAIERTCGERGYACHVQTARMAELMASADLAVAAGGGAVWERCCMGLPTIVYSLAQNQERTIRDAAADGIMYAPAPGPDFTASVALHLDALLANPLLLQSLSRRSLEAVDGNGASRVVRAMRSTAVTVREARCEDSDNLFTWRNDPGIRRVSRSSEAIERSSHDAWFEAALPDPDRVLLVGECGGQPVGVVRFDVADGGAEVSIYLVPGLQGQGLGPRLLRASERWLRDRRADVSHISAHVLGGNEPSHRLFRDAGYAMTSGLYAKQTARAS